MCRACRAAPLVTGMFGIRNGVANHGGARPTWPRSGPSAVLLEDGCRHLPAVLLQAGYHTASISSFPATAHWWTAGFLETMNLVRATAWSAPIRSYPAP
jgi:hypothetical protein